MTATGRVEDARLLRGQGRFVADAVPDGALHAVFLRAEVDCATLDPIDAGAARAMPGVVAVVTGEDVLAAGIGPLPQTLPPRDDGGAAVRLPMPLLAQGHVRHLGEPLAVVLAESRAAALDALEALEPVVRPLAPETGIAAVARVGDPAAAKAAIAGAVHQIRARVAIPRLTAVPLEMRGCVAVPAGDRLTLRTSTQNPFAVRKALAGVLGCDEAVLRILAPDVGGSFGLKGFLSREEAMVAWQAQVLGRPVAWMATRSESFLADHQGRGVVADMTLGLDADLRIVGLHGAFDVDLGAYPDRRAFGMANNAAGIGGIYDVPVAGAVVSGHLSPRAPLAPYRGNGRPEATLAIESVLDAAARQLGVDPVDLRRRNLLSPDRLPVTTPLGFPIDCGAFDRVLSAAEALADRNGVAKRRAEAAARGRLHGAGLAACLESAAGGVAAPRPDHARIVVTADGAVTLAAGVMAAGQGSETAFVRIAAAALGLPEDRIGYVNGDTEAVPGGRGMGGSSGLCVAGSAVHMALDRLIEEGRVLAAGVLGCAADAVRHDAVVFRVDGRNESVDLADLARRQPGGQWVVEATFAPETAVFPNGVHCCEVEIDPETGVLDILSYAAVEDVGRVLNPDLVEGQMQGGIGMGLAQVRGEAMRYDAEGQIVTGTFMDYYVARAADLPAMRTETCEVPTARNPLGAKGVGEAGTVGATAALMSAINDALAQRGITGFQMPATPLRLWQALNGVAS